MSRFCQTKIFSDYVRKQFLTDNHFRTELFYYRNYSWAAPKLFKVEDRVLYIEKLRPIYRNGDAVPAKRTEASLLERDMLWSLLERLHAEGINHCDVALCNVVRCPERGPLLIDWEAAERVSWDKSFDLYGPAVSGRPMHPETLPVWWGGPWNICPGPFWGDKL